MVHEFYWIIKGSLAGSGKPGLMNTMDSDLQFLDSKGINVIITLTENPIESEVESNGFQVFHFPIRDMSFPTPRLAGDICTKIVDSIDQNNPVLVHCKAGLGRTGTMLACTLVTLGKSPDEAINEIRLKNRGYIQTEAQKDFVFHYADYLSEFGSLKYADHLGD